MRRFVATVTLLILLLVPTLSFADDSFIQPPIGAHSISQPSPDDPFSFWDIVLMVWLDASILQPPIG